MQTYKRTHIQTHKYKNVQHTKFQTYKYLHVTCLSAFHRLSNVNTVSFIGLKTGDIYEISCKCCVTLELNRQNQQIIITQPVLNARFSH